MEREILQKIIKEWRSQKTSRLCTASELLDQELAMDDLITDAEKIMDG